MLIRYEGLEYLYIPVAILQGGEIQKTLGIPDLLLNFHAESQAVTVTICNVDPNKLRDYQITISTLYSMMADRSLPIDAFSTLYDRVRAEVLNHEVLKK